MPQNNQATAFTQVRGKGQVLLIEDCEHRGEHALLVERLRQQGLRSDRPLQRPAFQSLAELQPFDAVVLANVPRATNETSISPTIRSTCWCATRSRWAAGC